MRGFSALQRAEIAEMAAELERRINEERVSVLFNEPKLLKSHPERLPGDTRTRRFSALQRAEIAEIEDDDGQPVRVSSFSALQRAEIAEI